MTKLPKLIYTTILIISTAQPGVAATRGSVATQIGLVKDNAYAVAIQPDGKIVAVGASLNEHYSDFAVVRYNPNGTLDATFGDKGVALFDSRMGDDKAYAVVVQPDGKILAAGTVHNGKYPCFALLRFLSNGVLDPNFGRNGVFIKDFGRGESVAYAISLVSDDKIVLGGYASNGKDLDFALTRLDINGVLDLNFGMSGEVVTALGDQDNRHGNEHPYALLAQRDGKLVMVGYSEVDGRSVFVLVRYMPTGLVDHSFGVDGTVTTQIGKSQDRAYSAAFQRDGKIIVGGSTTTDFKTQFVLTRYLSNGILDPSFGDDGISTTTMGRGNDVIYSIAIQPDGKILAAGSFYDGTDTGVALARYMPDGKLDRSFGDGGKSLEQMEWKYSAAYAVALQSDGKILAAGVSSLGREYRVALARYLPTGSLDNSFGSNVTQVLARSVKPTPITAEIMMPGMLLKSLIKDHLWQ